MYVRSPLCVAPLISPQTPEWKRAYIDYRKLKKCIKAIQQRQISGQPVEVIKTTGTPRVDAERGMGHGVREDEREDSESDTGPSAFPRPKPTLEDPSKRRHHHLRPGSAVASPVPSRYGSMGKTPPMLRRRAPSPPELVLPDPSNPETDDTRVEPRKSTGTGTSVGDADAEDSASVRSRTPLARSEGKKHPHWVEPAAVDPGTTSGSGSGSGRDSSSGDEDRYLPPARKPGNIAAKSPRMMAAVTRTPSILAKSPRIFAGKASDKPGVTRSDSSKRNTPGEVLLLYHPP